MREFLFLFRGAESASLSPDEMQRQMQKWRAWIEDLARAGRFKSGKPLDCGGKVLADRGRLVTDRPFAESKEVVGGYLIVTAESLDDAVGLARGCPILEVGGTVEIRATQDMPM